MISALIVYLIGRFLTPETFVAEAIIRIVPTSGESPITQSTYANRIMNNYVEIATSGPFINSLRDRLGLPNDRPADVDVDTIPDSELLLISVEDTDPLLARDAANTIAEMLLDENPIRDIRITVIDPAGIPKSPSILTVLLYFYLVLILGLVAGIGVAFLIENLDTRIYKLQEIEKITNLPIIGQIPNAKGRKRGKFLVEEYPYSEAFRRLRINTVKISQKKDLKTIMLTSAQPKEGKSVISSNLAISLAQAGFRVILIDSDLHRPTLHEIFNMPDKRGIRDVVNGSLPLSEAIVHSGVHNLDLLLSGLDSSDKNEIIEIENLADFLTELRDKYDYVVLDTAAYLGVADTFELLDSADGVLLVTMQGHVRDNALRITYQQLNTSTNNLLGLIINKDTTPISDEYLHYQNPNLRHVRLAPQDPFLEEDTDGITEDEEVKASEETEGIEESEEFGDSKDPVGKMAPSDGRDYSSEQSRWKNMTRLTKRSVAINRLKRFGKQHESEAALDTIIQSANESIFSKSEVKSNKTFTSRTSAVFQRFKRSELSNQTETESHRPRIVFISGAKAFPEDIQVNEYVEIYNKAGYEVTVLSPHKRGLSDREKVDNTVVYRYPSPDGSKGYFGLLSNIIFSPLFGFFTLLRIWMSRGLDVLYIFNPPDTLASLGILPMLAGKSIIFEIREPIPEYFLSELKRSKNLFYKILCVLEKIASRTVTHTTISRDTHERILLTRDWLRADKVSVINRKLNFMTMGLSTSPINSEPSDESNSESPESGIKHEDDDNLGNALRVLKNAFAVPNWS
jgi:capsular exopolysaccharide synthesis family protein